MAQATLTEATQTVDEPRPTTHDVPVSIQWSGRVNDELVTFDEYCAVQTLIDDSVEVAL